MFQTALLLPILFGTKAPPSSPRPVAASIRRFEQNIGQWPDGVRFAARTPRGLLVLGAADARLRLRGADGRPTAIGLRWDAGARTIAGVERLPGVSNYLLGSDRDRWRRDVAGFRRVRYTEVAPRIDLEFYGATDGFEYDVVVRPGGDPRALTLRLDGVTRARVDEDGSIVFDTSAGPFRQHRPIAFQVREGVRTAVNVRYELRDGRIRFQADRYDRSQPLVIDPTFEFSTYLGGTGADTARAVATDAAGNIYVTGSTASIDFPTASPAYTSSGTTDVFVAKFSPNGQTLLYSTYLGGVTGTDAANGIAVTASGSAYVGGTTNSSDFPVVAGAFGSNPGGESGFVSRLSADGTTLIFSTYLGGSGVDRVEGLATDPAGAVYVTGPTFSPDFPLLNAYRLTPGGSFITKFTSAGSLVYSTYFGDRRLGGLSEFRVNLHAIAVDATGAAYVGGDALSNTLPATPGAYRTTPGSNFVCLVPPHNALPCLDGVVAKLTPSGTLAYATYLRGDEDHDVVTPIDTVSGIAVDAQGNAVVVGTTRSATFPTTPGATRSACAASLCSALQVFVTKLNASGSGLVFSSVLGGVGGGHTGTADMGPSTAFASTGTPSTGIAIDALGQTIVTGWTTAPDLPVIGAQQTGLASSSLFALTENGTVATPQNTPDGRFFTWLGIGSPGTLYAVSQSASSPVNQRLLRNEVGASGFPWKDVTPPSGFASPLTFDPNNNLTIYTAQVKSADRGDTWTAFGTTALTRPPTGRRNSPGVLFGIGNNASNGNSQILKSVDGGDTWTLSNTGIAADALLTGIAIALSDTNVMWTWGTSALYQSVDGGASWSARAFPDAGPHELLISSFYPSELLATGVSGIWKTVNAAVSWTKTQSLSFGGPIALTSGTSHMASGSFATYISSDEGDSWTLVQPIRATSLAVLSSPHTVFAVAAPMKDGFVAALSPTGSLMYESYLGGFHDDISYGLAVSPDGSIVVAGSTQSTNFPTVNAIQGVVGGGDAFVTKLRFPQPLMAVEAPSDAATLMQPFTLRGWALDRGSAADDGIDGIHVWAFPASGIPTFVGAPTPSLARPDIAALYGSQFANAGFSTTVRGLPPGSYTLAIYPHSSVTNTFAPPQLLTVQIANGGLISIGTPADGGTTVPRANFSGWAIDRSAASDTGVSTVHVWAYLNPGSGQAPLFAGAAIYGAARPDVGAIFGSQFTNSGFNLTLPPMPAGDYLFVAYPFSTVTNAFLPPATVRATVRASQPQGALNPPADNATVSGSFLVGGWAIDQSAPEGPGVDAVHVWAFPTNGGAATFLGAAQYGISRPDVGAIFGSQFTASGYSLTAPALPPGTYDVYAFSRSTVSGTFNFASIARITVQ